MVLSELQRKYLIHDQIIGSAIFNAFLNAFLAWLTFRHHEVVPMKGDPSIVGNAIGVAAILPLLSCLIVTPLVRKAIKSGKVEPLQTSSPGRSMILWLPRVSFVRGLVLSLICLAWATPLLLGVLMFAGVEHLSVPSFVIVNALYSALIAAFVAPVITLFVLATTAPSSVAAQPPDQLAFG